MDKLLRHTLEHAERYLSTADERHVAIPVTAQNMLDRFDRRMPADPIDPRIVIDELVYAACPGLVTSVGPRYFGFVTGGSLPVALAADWLTSTWDQLAGAFVSSPAAAAVEDIAGQWAADLLGLPQGVSWGFVTGATMANFTALAAARNEVLRRHGIDVAQVGMAGAPPIQVLAGAERHFSIDIAMRYLGLGVDQLTLVPVDDQGRMRPQDLASHLDRLTGQPIIVCAQSGNVNSGAFDPLVEICHLSKRANAWVHVDGAFGLWASASPTLAHLTHGVGLADSWAVDTHKWLNVPYDNALVFIREPDAHLVVTGKSAPYLSSEADGTRENYHYVPESSRRARGFTVYAALRSLGASGLAELIERDCSHARHIAHAFEGHQHIQVLNEVVLNQVLLRFIDPRGADDDAHTRTVIERINTGGTAWCGTTVWQGRTAMRISVTGWNTTEADMARTVGAILIAAE